MFGPQGRGWNRAAELPARAPAGTAVSRQDGDLCLPGSSRGCHCAPRLGDPQRGPSHQLKASGGGGGPGWQQTPKLLAESRNWVRASSLPPWEYFGVFTIFQGKPFLGLAGKQQTRLCPGP